ncbi:MAG TPA: AAA family ATPase [Bryobacteraceae bacterium]|nr:AAA family ATPase [Bryobacteraceae bacterium]
MSEKIIGQMQAIGAIAPFVQMYQAGLAPESRPAGVFLLLGPTGTGKTRTVEALAEVIHGSARNILRIDCGEFQMEHEVAKLVGAPPGYLGHRETQPILTQAKLSSVASEHSNLSLVLFDEIEKAAPSMTRLMLGILDKATLRLGDNNVVNFEKTFIFMTSNLGAQGIRNELHPAFGFQSGVARDLQAAGGKIENIARAAAYRQFAPEFLNRIDVAITFQPLCHHSLTTILDQQIQELQKHIDRRLGVRAFRIHVPKSSRQFLLKEGTSSEFGAREIKRTLHRHLTQPLAALVAENRVAPGSCLSVELSPDKSGLRLRAA